MSGRIKITPDRLRQCSATLRNEAETYDGVINKMDSVITELESDWEGAASREYRNQFDRLKPAFRDCYNLMQTMCTQLVQVAQANEDLDNEIGNRINMG